MKRTLYLKLEIDWEDYDDVSDELLFQDWLDSVQIDIVGTSLTLEQDLLEQQKLKTTLAMLNLFEYLVLNTIDINIRENLLRQIKSMQDGLTKKN